MKSSASPDIERTDTDDSTTDRRPYNSPVRRQQSAKTRQSIITAGTELARESLDWEWQNLTYRAVSERAGVSERTVYRYFATERMLKDAVIQQLVEDADINLEDVNLDEFADLTSRTFKHLSSYAARPEPISDPSFQSIDDLRREALLKAVNQKTTDWNTEQQEIVAAMLDMLWNPITYGRLRVVWGFENDQADRANNWLIGLIEEAIKQGNKP